MKSGCDMENNEIDIRLEQNKIRTKKSWSELFQRIYTDFSDLIEKEGQLVSVEIKEKKVKVKKALVWILLGATFLFLSSVCFTLTAILFMNLFTSLIVASGIVTISFLLLGLSLLFLAKKKLYIKNLTPEKSLEAFSEIRFFVQEKINEIKKH